MAKYIKRRELLFAGYAFKKSEGICIPIILLKLMQLYHSSKPELKIRAIVDNNPLHLECYYQNGLNNILKVKQYKLNYYPSDLSHGDILNGERFQNAKTIYDKDNLAFAVFTIYIRKSFRNHNVAEIQFELLAYDDNDIIIQKLKKKITWNLNRDISVWNFLRFGTQFALPNVENGYNLKQFNEQIEKILLSQKIKNIQIIKQQNAIQRLFYFAYEILSQETTKKEKPKKNDKMIIGSYHLYRFAIMNRIRIDHKTFQTFQKVLFQLNYK